MTTWTWPQARAILEQAAADYEECLPMGLSTSRQVVELLVDSMRQVFMPQPYLSQDHQERYFHQDVAELSDYALWKEIEKARFLLVWGNDGPDSWVAERLRACQAEQNRRKARET